MPLDPNELRFDSLKEAKDWYFVEYAPPIAGNPFAIVQLTILSDKNSADRVRIISAMKQELSNWLQRYPVMVMVFSFSAAGDLISFEPQKPSNHLMGRQNDTGEIESVWGSFESTELPPISPDALRAIYHDIPCKTGQEIALENEKEQNRLLQGMRVWRILLVLWLVIIPAGIAYLGFANPLVGKIALGYSMLMALVQLLKIFGKWPQMQRAKEKAVEDLAKNHHHYHCKKNPEGFMRLKVQNFDREEREKRIRMPVDANPNPAGNVVLGLDGGVVTSRAATPAIGTT